MSPVLGQCMAQVRRTHKTGCQVVLMIFDIGSQGLQDPFPVLLAGQVKIQGQHRPGLGLADNPSRIGIVFLAECFQGVVIQL